MPALVRLPIVRLLALPGPALALHPQATVVPAGPSTTRPSPAWS
jgi:hypothetical protein